MKNKFLILTLSSLALIGCSKTNDLYKQNAYNSSVFSENYYTSYDGLNERTFDCVATQEVSPTKLESDKFESSLIQEYSEFRYGILGKLYDGRTSCGGLFQRSRVQLNNNGFGTLVPKHLNNVTTFGFASRGGSTCSTPLYTYLNFNFEISLYSETTKWTYSLKNIEIPVDHSSETYLYRFDINNIDELIGYSLSFECNEFAGKENVAESDELALMLYEVYMCND